MLAVTSITTLNEMVPLAVVAALGGGQLEGPQEGVGLLEVGTNSVDLVDDILNADDTNSAQSLLNDIIGGDGNTLSINLGKSALVDQLANGLQVGVAIGDEGLNQTEHLDGWGVKTHESGVVDLEETEKLKNFASFGVNTIDTSDADDDSELGLSGNIEVSSLLSLAASSDLSTLQVVVLLGVGLGSLVDLTSVLQAFLKIREPSQVTADTLTEGTYSLEGLAVSLILLTDDLCGLLFLQNSLRNILAAPSHSVQKSLITRENIHAGHPNDEQKKRSRLLSTKVLLEKTKVCGEMPQMEILARVK
jgi:hypothetical protein